MKKAKIARVIVGDKGGPGSGFHGHAGRQGKRGGSTRKGIRSTIVHTYSDVPNGPIGKVYYINRSDELVTSVDEYAGDAYHLGIAACALNGDLLGLSDALIKKAKQQISQTKPNAKIVPISTQDDPIERAVQELMQHNETQNKWSLITQRILQDVLKRGNIRVHVYNNVTNIQTNSIADSILHRLQSLVHAGKIVLKLGVQHLWTDKDDYKQILFDAKSFLQADHVYDLTKLGSGLEFKEVKSAHISKVVIRGTKGGPGSGFHGHAGRIGKVGGSAMSGASRYSTGDTKRLSSEEIYNDSSDEVKTLADETGLVATDDATFEYIQGMQKSVMSDSVIRMSKPYLLKARVTHDEYDKEYKIYVDDIQHEGNAVYGLSALMNKVDSVSSKQLILAGYTKEQVKHIKQINNELIVSVRSTSYEQVWKDLSSTSEVQKLMEQSRIRGETTEYDKKISELQQRIRDQRIKTAHEIYNGFSDSDKSMLIDIATTASIQRHMNGSDAGTGVITRLKMPKVRFSELPRGNFDVLKWTEQRIQGAGLDPYEISKVLSPKTAAKKMQHNPGTLAALVSLNDIEAHRLASHIDDTAVSGHNIKYKVQNMFGIRPNRSVLNDFESTSQSRGNVLDYLFHGSDMYGSQSIASEGFKIGRKRTAHTLGDGIYLAANSTKSMQYTFGSFGTFSSGIGRQGILLAARAALGKIINATRSNMNPKEAGSVYAHKDSGYWNPEYCVRDSRAVLPMYWIHLLNEGAK